MRHLRQFSAMLLAIAALSSSSAMAADNGKNCNLRQAPSGAKRTPTHGVDFLVYPASIENAYTGCQVTWLGNSHKLSTVFYKNGIVQWLEAWEPKSDKPYRCHFNAGALVKEGADPKCPESHP